MLIQILISEKELSNINFERFDNNFFDSDNNIYLTADSLIDINKIITALNNINRRKVNVKSNVYDKMYIEEHFIEGNCRSIQCKKS